ncbi:MAG TPA: hypothetical protein VE961_27570 [Pyrinomonadaceae bacterium]|nr:hypothetical protein [Pyrinomonadaceae bacterium]
MKSIAILSGACLLLVACTYPNGAPVWKLENPIPPQADAARAEKNSVTVIHLFVALCDNIHQGIVPVSATLGNGDDAQRNLYWGAAFGVKTFFAKDRDWRMADCRPGPDNGQFVIERCVFKRKDREAFLVADAYRGSEIQRSTQTFLQAAAGYPGESISVAVDGKSYSLHLHGSAALVAYTGHDGLMDFQLASPPNKRDNEERAAIILACASKSYFAEVLHKTGARPLLWTTNLMAPEAYILAAAIDGWLRNENDEQIRVRAARAYNQYQHCGERSANNLFATGW